MVQSNGRSVPLDQLYPEHRTQDRGPTHNRRTARNNPPDKFQTEPSGYYFAWTEKMTLKFHKDENWFISLMFMPFRAVKMEILFPFLATATSFR